MASKESLKNIKAIVQKHLDTIFDNATISFELKTNKEFQKIVEKNIDILASCENILLMKKIINKTYASKYNKVAEVSYTINNSLKLENENDVLDEINWLVVYIKNQYRIDIDTNDSFGEEIKVTNEATVAQTTDTQSFNNDWLALTQKMRAPYERLEKEIQSGRVYVYKSKPKHMPFIKAFFAIDTIVLGCLLILFSMAGFVLAGVDGLKSFTSVVSDLFILIFGVMLILSGVKTTQLLFSHKMKNNDNNKYHFRWQNYMVTNVILGLFILSCVVDFDNGQNIFSTALETMSGQSQLIQAFIWILFVSIILVLFSYISSVTILIVASRTNPAFDNEKVQSLLKQYINEETAGITQPEAEATKFD